MTNKLFYGDNLNVLREQIASESVDLIYLDPPFNSNANYNILFKSKTGDGSDAQIEAFETRGTGTTRLSRHSTKSRAAAIPRRST
jgi:16S rRNA G966 N2-methylase RsmD